MFFLSAWEICSVTSIYKSSDPIDVKNYHPILIIPHIAKLFEVYNRVKHSFSHVIIEKQHGFRPGKSTITSSFVNLIECLEQESKVVTKALKILGFIKRVPKTFYSANCLRLLYFSLVRSKLKYGVEI